MVDLNTAMAAAAGERQKRMADEGKERKKRRSGSDLGIEAFDPVKHVTKEKAETVSMWLVIGFSVLVSLLMRYVLMPRTSVEKSDILYLAPLAAIALIPQVHRIVLPESLNEVYTKGTWFKAGFLHTFTFLAMSFLLVNPPMGDIVAPKLASHWAIATDDGEILLFNEDSSKDGIIEWEVENDGRLDAEVWLLFALADNVNSDGAEVKVELTHQSVVTELASDDYYWANNSDRITNATKTDNSSAPNLVPHSKDQPFAINLGSDLAVGSHDILVTITEEGDPWENERVYKWKLVVVEAVESTDSGE